MNGLLGKRFIFATIMGICVSVVSVILKYPDVAYIKLVGILAGIFTLGQSLTDWKEAQNGKGETK